MVVPTEHDTTEWRSLNLDSPPNDPECPEDRKFKLLPIQTVIEDVASWEECGMLSL